MPLFLSNSNVSDKGGSFINYKAFKVINRAGTMLFSKMEASIIHKKSHFKDEMPYF